MGETKICKDCGVEKPLSDYYLTQGKYPQPRCKPCANRKRGDDAKAQRAGEKEKEAKLNICAHNIRLCGDAAVLAKFPMFFAEHDHAGGGQEWQVCKECGDAKLVQVYAPTAEDAAFGRIVTLTRESRAIAGARELEYARNGAGPSTGKLGEIAAAVVAAFPGDPVLLEADTPDVAPPDASPEPVEQADTIGGQLVAALEEVDRLKGLVAETRRECERLQQENHTLNTSIKRERARSRVVELRHEVGRLVAEIGDIIQEFGLEPNPYDTAAQREEMPF